MSMQSHTPGPWFVRDGMDGGLMIHSGRGPVVDARWEGGSQTTLDMGEADARLIAAAPELLEALNGLLSIVSESNGVAGYHLNGNVAEWDEFDELNVARDAIQKATGGDQ